MCTYYDVLCSYFAEKHIPKNSIKYISNLNIFFLQHKKLSDTSYSFDCQHGERECKGNTVHACAIKHIGDQDKVVQHVVCMMTDFYNDAKDSGMMFQV